MSLISGISIFGDGDDLRAGEGAFHLEDLAQHVGGQPNREQVQADAGDELVHLQYDGEQDEYQSHQDGANDGEQDTHAPGVKVIRAQHGKKGAAQHHAFHGNVEDAGVKGERAAQRRQQDGGGGGDHAVDHADDDVHVALSFILRRASIWAKNLSK